MQVMDVTNMSVVELGETSGGVEPVEEGWVELPILPVDLAPSSTGVVASSSRPGLWWQPPVVSTPASSWGLELLGVVVVVLLLPPGPLDVVVLWRPVWKWRPPVAATLVFSRVLAFPEVVVLAFPPVATS